MNGTTLQEWIDYANISTWLHHCEACADAGEPAGTFPVDVLERFIRAQGIEPPPRGTDFKPALLAARQRFEEERALGSARARICRFAKEKIEAPQIMAWDSEIEKDTAQLFYALELCQQEPYGIDPNIVAGAIQLGDECMIAQVAQRLLALPDSRKGRSLVNYLCATMVARCAARQIPPPSGLVLLLNRQLSADTFAARAVKKPLALTRAAQYSAAFPDASLRAIADYAGINHNTVATWKANGQLQELADAYEKLAPGITDLMREMVLGEKGLP